MNECLVRGIDPESSDAPESIVEAVAILFEPGADPKGLSAGRIRNWPDAKRTEVARGITFAATGASPQQGNPCFTISDSGEGQTPDRMPETFLSLTKSNKLRIPFVQGKFNIGGTGALKFLRAAQTCNSSSLVHSPDVARVSSTTRQRHPADLPTKTVQVFPGGRKFASDDKVRGRWGKEVKSIRAWLAAMIWECGHPPRIAAMSN